MRMTQTHAGSPLHYLLGCRPRNVPPGEWKNVCHPRWPICLAASVAMGASLFMLLIILIEGSANPIGFTAIRTVVVAIYLGTLLGACTALSVIPRVRKRRFQSTVVALQYEVCLGCGYDLNGLPAKHCCPECGMAFDKEQVRAAWRKRYGANVTETSP